MLTVYQAAYEDKLFIVKQMVEKDPSLVQSVDEDGRTALHWAASGGHASIVEYLMNKGAIVNNPDKDAGWTPLMIAVAAGHEDVVKLLLPQSDVNHQNESNHTAL
ncbi:prosome, macropain 26S subunit, non-ATPase, 10, isoform CRA_c [Mucor mucedo]|nr:prosome, macropain 26S subunit, non-ATPase, 10, isoform CRA_c [Mucor mucedo]KAI7890678.1 prosome, macropain 26S subunit, non-ATPase, 10, isoform CRA_c [Mucor mucedo]